MVEKYRLIQAEWLTKNGIQREYICIVSDLTKENKLKSDFLEKGKYYKYFCKKFNIDENSPIRINSKNIDNIVL